MHDRWERLTEWRHPDGGTVALGDIPIEDGEVSPPDALEDMEPDEQHFREATGNEGASFDRTYRRAALVLWPRQRRLAVINQAGPQATLPYLESLAARWLDEGAQPGSSHWAEATSCPLICLRLGQAAIGTAAANAMTQMARCPGWPASSLR